MIHQIDLLWGNEMFILSNLRSVFHPASKSLVISDLHLGKSAHFRKNGIGIPVSIAKNDLENLTSLLHKFKPKNLIIAGDFFHAEINSEIELFRAFKDSFKYVRVFLIKGNHDRWLSRHYDDLQLITSTDFMLTPQIQIVHQAVPNSEFMQISGHLHPGVRLTGKGKQSLRLPAFVYNATEMILPAFSKFTGLYTRFTQPPYQFIAVSPTLIMPL